MAQCRARRSSVWQATNPVPDRRSSPTNAAAQAVSLARAARRAGNKTRAAKAANKAVTKRARRKAAARTDDDSPHGKRPLALPCRDAFVRQCRFAENIASALAHRSGPRRAGLSRISAEQHGPPLPRPQVCLRRQGRPARPACRDRAALRAARLERGELHERRHLRQPGGKPQG